MFRICQKIVEISLGENKELQFETNKYGRNIWHSYKRVQTVFLFEEYGLALS